MCYWLPGEKAGSFAAFIAPTLTAKTPGRHRPNGTISRGEIVRNGRWTARRASVSFPCSRDMNTVGAITAIWWMPFYPVWSFVYVVLGVMVVDALAAHGQKEPEGWVTEQAAASQARPAASSSM
jgi:hypothetical protein